MLHYTHFKSTKHCNSFVAQCMMQSMLSITGKRSGMTHSNESSWIITHTPLAITLRSLCESMKACALAYVLDHKQFLNSQAGSKYINDNHLGLLAYLFPHLDPWGIGGFHHPSCQKTQRLSFDVQVRCLLRQYHSPFARDASFPFVCWNIMQKQAVSRNSFFSMKASAH